MEAVGLHTKTGYQRLAAAYSLLENKNIERRDFAVSSGLYDANFRVVLRRLATNGM